MLEFEELSDEQKSLYKKLEYRTPLFKELINIDNTCITAIDYHYTEDDKKFYAIKYTYSENSYDDNTWIEDVYEVEPCGFRRKVKEIAK